MTKYTHTLLLLFISTFAFAQVDTTLYSRIDDDPRYEALLNEYTIYVEREDSLRLLILEARERYAELKNTNSSAAKIENISSQILNFEQEVLDIRTRQRQVVGGIANLDQRYIINQINRGSGEVKDYSYSSIKEDNVEHEQLIHNGIVARSLSAGGYADLKLAQQEDEQMPRLVEEYIATYKRMGRCVRAYNIATDEGEGDSIYDNYLSLRDMADSLGGVIDSYWSHILNAKYYAYGYILERYGLYHLLDNSSADFSNMQQVCANEDGKYQLDALMHYALGRPTLVAFERDFANEMGLSKAADSLKRVYDAILQPEYRLEPITLERKLFVEYEPLRFGAKDFYRDTNPIPEVKVYTRGTIYRILLGTYRNLQTPSIFKGAQPLYVAKGESGYSYYVAGYASEEEANIAVEELMAKGFKEPEVCCWHDGKLRNSDESESEDADTEVSQTLGHRYIVLLECSTISESMRSTISAVAPDKRISRRGVGFAIGTFTARSDAESLQKVLSEDHPNIKVSIIELNIQ